MKALAPEACTLSPPALTVCSPVSSVAAVWYMVHRTTCELPCFVAFEMFDHDFCILSDVMVSPHMHVHGSSLTKVAELQGL